MDRYQILEDLKEWGGWLVQHGQAINGGQLRDKIDELEEYYE